MFFIVNSESFLYSDIGFKPIVESIAVFTILDVMESISSDLSLNSFLFKRCPKACKMGSKETELSD